MNTRYMYFGTVFDFIFSPERSLRSCHQLRKIKASEGGIKGNISGQLRNQQEIHDKLVILCVPLNPAIPVYVNIKCNL
jgi:hypothetical protein